MRTLCCVLGLLFTCALFCIAQVTIINSGSTNSPGMNIKLDDSSTQATIERRDGSTQKFALDKDLCSQLMQDLKTAGPLNELPATHCMKSVSFGSSLYIEHNGTRSPDLNCPQSDPRSVALKKDASAILAAAKTNSPLRRRAL
jgi:hypothetical protein